MKKYKYLLFDLDGTIFDTFQGITRSFAYALDYYGIHIDDLKELSPVIGPPLYDCFVSMFGFDHQKALDAVAKYRERYNVKFIEESRLYPGIKEVLEKLSNEGFSLVLATSKPEHFAVDLLKHYHIFKYFTFVGCASLDKSRDTKNKVLEYIIQELGIEDKSQAVMIGDRKFDLLGAASFGIDAIGVHYGFAPQGELENCPHVYLAKNVEELYNYISRG